MGKDASITGGAEEKEHVVGADVLAVVVLLIEDKVAVLIALRGKSIADAVVARGREEIVGVAREGW